MNEITILKRLLKPILLIIISIVLLFKATNMVGEIAISLSLIILLIKDSLINSK